MERRSKKVPGRYRVTTPGDGLVVTTRTKGWALLCAQGLMVANADAGRPLPWIEIADTMAQCGKAESWRTRTGVRWRRHSVKPFPFELEE